MRNFQVRSDGPPDNEWFGSFDGFQTEFSISQLVEEKFTPTNNARAKPCADFVAHDRCVWQEGMYCEKSPCMSVPRTASPIASTLSETSIVIEYYRRNTMPCPGSVCQIYFVCKAVYPKDEPPCSSDAKVSTPSASDNTQSNPCSHIGDPIPFAAYRVCKKCGEVYDS